MTPLTSGDQPDAEVWPPRSLLFLSKISLPVVQVWNNWQVVGRDVVHYMPRQWLRRRAHLFACIKRNGSGFRAQQRLLKSWPEAVSAFERKK
jgi:hypothetical protein